VQDRLLAATRTGRQPAAAPEEPPSGMTPREREVLTLIGQGLSNRGISERLFVSEATVKTHINNLFAKAGLHSRADAVRLALKLR